MWCSFSLIIDWLCVRQLWKKNWENSSVSVSTKQTQQAFQCLFSLTQRITQILKSNCFESISEEKNTWKRKSSNYIKIRKNNCHNPFKIFKQNQHKIRYNPEVEKLWKTPNNSIYHFKPGNFLKLTKRVKFF